MNLLSYPTLAQQRRVFHRWWSSLAGVWVGCVLAWLGQQWQHAATQRLVQEESQLAASWQDRQQQAKVAKQQDKLQRQQAEQIAHLQRLGQHQQAWRSLYERLQDMAAVQGLRLVRLQSEAGLLELHGEMDHFEAMAQARQSLAAQWGQTIRLQSVTVGPAKQVDFVWQTTWPALSSAPPVAGHLAARAKP